MIASTSTYQPRHRAGRHARGVPAEHEMVASVASYRGRRRREDRRHGTHTARIDNLGNVRWLG